MAKQFTRTIEDFICEHCGFFVKGDGYTNHCPQCLWSKHVDIQPGDRASGCEGLMKPIGSLFTAGEFSVIHKCLKCGFQKRNKIKDGDSFDELVQVVKKISAEK